MHRKYLFTIPQIALIVLVTMLVSAVGVLAATGTTDSPAAPGSTSSYMLEDIYQRLDTGAAGSQSTFTEPSVAPGAGTMHDLNDIMGAAPALDTTDGATTADVLNGKTFWGLTNGEWGLQTGTGDPNLLPINTRHGVTVFGVTGIYRPGWLLHTTTSEGSTLRSVDMLSATDGYKYRTVVQAVLVEVTPE